MEVENRIQYLKKMDTKRQYSSINPNSVQGHLGPQEGEVNAGLVDEGSSEMQIVPVREKASSLSVKKRSNTTTPHISQPKTDSADAESKRKGTENDVDPNEIRKLHLEIKQMRLAHEMNLSSGNWSSAGKKVKQKTHKAIPATDTKNYATEEEGFSASGERLKQSAYQKISLNQVN
jgi:hypothetical protein